MTTRTLLLATGLERTLIQAISAATQQPLVFTAYGHRHASSGPPSLGYNGERLQALTGHYLLGNGYRAYNPVLMRFNSPDNLSPFGAGGLNAYSYCAGDPTNQTDPTGHLSFANGPQRVVRSAPSKPIAYKETKTNQNWSGFTHITQRRYPGMERLGSYGGDAFWFQEPSKRRLTVVAHGTPDGVIVGGKIRTAAQLFDHLKGAGVKFEQVSRVRLLSCRSADLGANSPAAQFAKRSGKETKGYRGFVLFTLDDIMNYEKTRPSPADALAFVRREFRVKKRDLNSSPLPRPDASGWDRSLLNHQSVSFKP